MTGGLTNIDVYPTIAASATSATPATHLTLSSQTGTIYVGAIAPDLLEHRTFLVTSGLPIPAFEISSQALLRRVPEFINTAPDEDALIILNVHGPNIDQNKWLYATKEPYIEIEPAWMFIMSMGVLR